MCVCVYVCLLMYVCVHILILIRIYCATQKATMRKTCRPLSRLISAVQLSSLSLSVRPSVRLSGCLFASLFGLSMPAWLQYVFHLPPVRILSRVYQLVFSGHFIQALPRRSPRDFSSSKVFSRRPHPHPLTSSPCAVRQAN